MKLRFWLAIGTKIQSFLSSFLLKLKFKTLLPNFYYDSIPKPRFCLVITIQIWIFASDFSFEFKLEVLLSNSNSVRIQFKWEDETEMKHWFQFLLQIQLEPLSLTFWTRKFFSYFLFEWEVGNNISNSNLNQKKRSKMKLLTLN